MKKKNVFIFLLLLIWIAIAWVCVLLHILISQAPTFITFSKGHANSKITKNSATWYSWKHAIENIHVSLVNTWAFYQKKDIFSFQIYAEIGRIHFNSQSEHKCLSSTWLRVGCSR